MTLCTVDRAGYSIPAIDGTVVRETDKPMLLDSLTSRLPPRYILPYLGHRSREERSQNSHVMMRGGGYSQQQLEPHLELDPERYALKGYLRASRDFTLRFHSSPYSASLCSLPMPGVDPDASSVLSYTP